MSFWHFMLTVITGAGGYWANHFLVAPILEFSRLRREILQKTIEYSNIWVKLSETENAYYQTRIYDAANTYRVLGARLEAFAECLAHEKHYKWAAWWLGKYDFKAASTALFGLEGDALNPSPTFRKNEISLLHTALHIKRKIAFITG